MTTPVYTVADIVKNSIEDKPADMQNALHAVMLDKIKERLDAKRQEMIDNFYNVEAEEGQDTPDGGEDEYSEVYDEDEDEGESEETVDTDEEESGEEETDENAE